jgi:hypothetical protein
VGVTDGSATGDVSSIGIDFDSWTAAEGLSTENGAVFWMNPTKAPSTWPCVVAQVTVPSNAPWSATVSARGKLDGYAGGGGDDWVATDLVFSDATVPAFETGGEGQDETGHRRRLGLQHAHGPHESTWPPTGTGCDALHVPGGTVVYSPCFTGSPGCSETGATQGQTSTPTAATNQATVTCKSGGGYTGEVIRVSCIAGQKMSGEIWKNQPVLPVWESTPLCVADPDSNPSGTVPVRPVAQNNLRLLRWNLIGWTRS